MIPTRPLVRLVRRLAWRLAPPGPTRRQERPDFEQELWTHLLEAWPDYDPARGTEGAFAHAVLLRAGRSIVRARYARKRRPVDAEDWPPLPETEELFDAAAEADIVRAERRLDLDPALARLPADLRALADLLETHTVSEAARELGVPRSSLQRTLARLRGHFGAAGLDPRHQAVAGEGVARVRT